MSTTPKPHPQPLTPPPAVPRGDGGQPKAGPHHAVLIGGTWDGRHLTLTRTPERIQIGDELYRRLSCPDTGDYLGGYVTIDNPAPTQRPDDEQLAQQLAEHFYRAACDWARLDGDPVEALVFDRFLCAAQDAVALVAGTLRKAGGRRG